MKELIVKHVSHKDTLIPRTDEHPQPSESLFISKDIDVPSLIPKRFNSFSDLNSILAVAVKITLSVDNLSPNSNFMNIWIGSQLLKGTTIFEDLNKITGFLEDKPSSHDAVFLEFPDGEKKEFNITISEDNTE
ncbi:hypothetical protein B7489_17315 [Vibrio alginolyticus]|uniref:hypothetical protein n=1 Tax=Vibrio alginolyticus TaxID=663 RepID=UPI000A1E6673|nr:hypothetical protein [Vibrio alginolyticus]ELB2798315.1 hypothetical protein [Vibrio alginolyticus]OSP11798.1 hypothetical protein B7489_17315 [Vibrio alginolyticus]